MKRLLVGALLMPVLLAGIVSEAHAEAQIPPTPECESTSKRLFKAYVKEISEGVSDRQEEAAGLEMIEALSASSCISDAEPFLDKVELEPYTAECRTGAATAGKFWAPRKKKILAMYRVSRKDQRAFKRRAKTIRKRIERLRKTGGSERRINRLLTKSNRLEAKLFRRSLRDGMKLLRLSKEHGYADLLIVYELISLRCLPSDFADEDLEAATPAARAFRKNALVIYNSLLFLVIDAMGDLDSSANARTSAIGDANRTTGFQGGGLPGLGNWPAPAGQ